MRKPAELRLCASCEWVFTGGVECPQCQFGSYGAFYIYGHKAYTYKKTQKPWLEKKMIAYEIKLLEIIDKNRPKDDTKHFRRSGY